MLMYPGKLRLMFPPSNQNQLLLFKLQLLVEPAFLFFLFPLLDAIYLLVVGKQLQWLTIGELEIWNVSLLSSF